MVEVYQAPDGGLWAWLAVFGCFMGNVIGDGAMYSFGIFLPVLKDRFNCGAAEISTVNSIQMGVTFAAGPVASFLTNMVGWRLTTIIGSVIAAAGFILSAFVPNVYFLYITAGVLIGLGLGIIYVPRLDCITQYFDKRRPFVTGVAICGSGIGTAIFAPFTDFLLTQTTTRDALIIIGMIILSNCFFGLLFKPLKSLGYENNSTEEVSFLEDMWSLLLSWVFMMFAVSNFLTSLGYPIPYTFVPDNGKELGLTSAQGGYLVGLIGISNTVARLVLGLLSQTVNRLFLYNTFLVICGISMGLTNYFQPIMAVLASTDCTVYENITSNSSSIPILATEMVNATNLTEADYLPWMCDQYYGQLLYAILYGISSAAYVLLTTLVLADLLGADKFTNAFGLLLLFQGVATFIGPPVVGAIFDQTGSYNGGFILMGGMISLSGLMLYPIPYIQNRLRQRQQTDNFHLS